jgi:hypothetical protein
MGRPIKKKFFGNLNYPYTDYPTSQITGEGGEGVASVTVTAPGSYTSALPTVAFGQPNLPDGVTAVGTVHGNALSAVATAAGSGYAYGNVLTPSGGTVRSAATFTVTGLTVVGLTLNNGGSRIDNGDEYTFDGSYSGGSWTVALRVRITNAVGGVVQPGGWTVVTPGVWSGAAAPANTGGARFTQVADGIDHNGTGLILNLTSWGVATVAVTTQGDYTAIASGARATTSTPTVTPGGATLTVTYGVSGVEVTTTGSGYVSVADAALTFTPASTTAASSVLTTAFQNALDIFAWVPTATNGSVNSGGSAIEGDIDKQEASRRYYVRTRQGQGICKLVTTTPAIGEMTLIARDTNGSQYYVKKLTARRVILVQKTMVGSYLFATNQAAGWTLGSASLGVVTIANV